MHIAFKKIKAPIALRQRVMHTRVTKAIMRIIVMGKWRVKFPIPNQEESDKMTG